MCIAISTDVLVVWSSIKLIYGAGLAVLAFWVCAFPAVSFAAQETISSSSEEKREEQRQRVAREMTLNRQKIIKRFPGYGKYARQFRAVCDIVAADGRGPFLYEFGAAQNIKRPDCAGCKSFYKVLSKSCRPQLAGRTKKAKENTEKLLVKQRQPHTVAIQRSSELGYLLSADGRNLAEHYQVLTDFQALLKKSESISPAARDYAIMLLEPMLAHFEAYEKDIFKKAQKRKQQRQGLSFIERDKAEEWAELEELFHYEQEH